MMYRWRIARYMLRLAWIHRTDKSWRYWLRLAWRNVFNRRAYS